jgi:Type III secretory pathway, lipoprotein EscJ
MTIIQQFVDEAKDLMPLLQISADQPDNPNGIYWLDIESDDFTTAVSWSAGHGFGFYTQDNIYGERPDEIYKKPAMAARRLQQLYMSRNESQSDQIVPWLRQLRALVDLPQTTVAEKLDIQQAAISRLESRSDIKLSSLLAYMKALDIQLEIKAHNADFEMSVPLRALHNPGKELN